MKIRKLKDLSLKGKRVLVRLDLNVPLKGGVIQDDTRIRSAIPTLRAILEQTSKVVVMSHLGRPKGDKNSKYSLEPVGVRLAELLGLEVLFVEEYLEESVINVVDQASARQIILLENLRFHPGETANDVEFSRSLATGFDCYVNDAFGTLHRSHASVVGVTEQMAPNQCAAGLLVEKEMAESGELMSAPKAPFTVIMGGSKVSDKIGVTLNLLNRCNNLIIGGAMAYTFLKYHGVEVGSSRVEEDKLDLVDKIYRNAESRRVNVYIPVDHICAASFSEDSLPVSVDGAAISEGLMGLDIGPKTLQKYSEVIGGSQTVLWNGPMGVFEWKEFSSGSLGIAAAMKACQGRTVIGGGDSVSVANMAGVVSDIDHVSTGGGASLEFLEGKLLPGVKVLNY